MQNKKKRNSKQLTICAGEFFKVKTRIEIKVKTTIEGPYKSAFPSLKSAPFTPGIIEEINLKCD
jgi:hypothetical protein